MNEILAHHPQMRELRQLVAELVLISHVSGTSYDGKMSRATDEEPGGKRPSGSDVDKPRRPGPLASAKQISDWRDELQSWLTSYQRRTPEYFRDEIEKCDSLFRLQELCVQAADTLRAWRRAPEIPKSLEPPYGSPQWKRYVAESKEDAGAIASRYWNPTTGKNITRQYIYKIRRQYGTMDEEAA